jgi:hypothetical protein
LNIYGNSAPKVIYKDLKYYSKTGKSEEFLFVDGYKIIDEKDKNFALLNLQNPNDEIRCACGIVLGASYEQLGYKE